MGILKHTVQWFVIGLFAITGYTTVDTYQTAPFGINLPEATPFVTPDFQITDPIVKLLGLTGIRIKNDPLPSQENWPEPHLTLTSRDITEVMEAIQGKKKAEISWLRGANQERWEVTGLAYLSTPLAASAIVNIALKDLPQAEEVRPKDSSYKGIVLLGTSLSDFFVRVQYLKSLSLNPSIPITILTGERLLDEKIKETYDHWLKLTDNKGTIEGGADNFPKDESAMMELVMKYSGLPYQLCHASKLPGTLRSTTADTLKEWFKLNPEPGKYLFISSQPFVAYQSLVVKRLLLQGLKEKAIGYPIETVGSPLINTLAAGHDDLAMNKKALIALDSIARIIYELHSLQALTKN